MASARGEAASSASSTRSRLSTDLKVQREAVRFDARQIQEVVDQRLHVSRRSPDALGAAAQCACALLVTGACQVQHHSAWSRIAESGLLRSWDTTASRSSRARTARCSLKKPPLDVDFDGAALQLVGGLEVARRPRMRAEPHLLSPERKRMTRAQALAGIRRDGLGWIAAPVHRLDELRAEPQESPLGSAGQREREQPTGDVAGLQRPREQGAQRRGGERPETLPSRRPTPRCPG